MEVIILLVDMLRGWSSIIMLAGVFFGIPVAIIILFVVKLSKFLKKSRQNKINPGAFSEDIIKKDKIAVIIFGVLSSGAIFYIVNLVNILNRPIAFMWGGFYDR